MIIYKDRRAGIALLFTFIALLLLGGCPKPAEPPVKPVVPVKPAKPVVLVKPTKPVVPVKPAKPVVPVKPARPVEAPEKPAHSFAFDTASHKMAFTKVVHTPGPSWKQTSLKATHGLLNTPQVLLR